MRRNSIFYMFERMVEQHQAVITILYLVNRNNYCITSEEFQQLKNVVTTLQPFEVATRETSAEKFFPYQIINAVYCLEGNELPLVSVLQTQLLQRFGSMECNHNLVAAILLDPRLKKLAF